MGERPNKWGDRPVTELYNSSSNSLCKWLHEQLQQLPLVKFPFDLDRLPRNGIYFFYEAGEDWGHGGSLPRIVKIGTSTGNNNFRSRIGQHYLLNEAKMDFDASKPAPKDRSVFRKHIGRALLNKAKDMYLSIWNIDFTKRENRRQYKHLRDIEREKTMELAITKQLRERFFFRFITLGDSKEQRLGLEKHLIATVAQCSLCRPSPGWLGSFSLDERIQQNHLWLIQGAKDRPINEADKKTISEAIARTQEGMKLQ